MLLYPLDLLYIKVLEYEKADAINCFKGATLQAPTIRPLIIGVSAGGRLIKSDIPEITNINYLELKAVYFGLQTFKDQLASKYVCQFSVR